MRDKCKPKFCTVSAELRCLKIKSKSISMILLALQDRASHLIIPKSQPDFKMSSMEAYLKWSALKIKAVF